MGLSAPPGLCGFAGPAVGQGDAAAVTEIKARDKLANRLIRSMELPAKRVAAVRDLLKEVLYAPTRGADADDEDSEPADRFRLERHGVLAIAGAGERSEPRMTDQS